MVGRIITGPDDIAEGMGWLAARDSRFADAYALTGPLPLRRKPEGFAELLSAIVSQQVSVASARAIWARVEAAGGEEDAVAGHGTGVEAAALILVPGVARAAVITRTQRLDDGQPLFYHPDFTGNAPGSNRTAPVPANQ